MFSINMMNKKSMKKYVEFHQTYSRKIVHVFKAFRHFMYVKNVKMFVWKIYKSSEGFSC